MQLPTSNRKLRLVLSRATEHNIQVIDQSVGLRAKREAL